MCLPSCCFPERVPSAPWQGSSCWVIVLIGFSGNPPGWWFGLLDLDMNWLAKWDTHPQPTNHPTMQQVRKGNWEGIAFATAQPRGMGPGWRSKCQCLPPWHLLKRQRRPGNIFASPFPSLLADPKTESPVPAPSSRFRLFHET